VAKGIYTGKREFNLSEICDTYVTDDREFRVIANAHLILKYGAGIVRIGEWGD
jgi:hypothetical protein